jgi:hypothetical protein
LDAATHERAGVGVAVADRVAGGRRRKNTEIAAELGIHRNVAGNGARAFWSTGSTA